VAARMPQVNHHVNLFLEGATPELVYVRSGTITAVTDIDTITVRVGHHSETYAAVPRKVRDHEDVGHATLPSWTPR
jgi:hypothetical protein